MLLIYILNRQKPAEVPIAIKYLDATALLMKLFEAYNIGCFGVASINFEFLVTTDWPLYFFLKVPS